MYHVELRQFPHNMCRFNLTDVELRAIVEPWALEKVVDFGERKWNSQMARITILDGPRMALEQLTMGRGWRAAQRQSQDVTERVLAAAKESLAAAQHASALPDRQALAQRAAAPTGTAVPGMGAQAGALADPLALGVQLASLLGDDPEGLLSAWKEVAARSSDLSPSKSLALAERQLNS
jgi:hypothetical protein